MPNFIQGIAVLLLALLVSARAASAAPVDEMLAERALGDEAAPVTIVEYSSLACPHCAAFHRETLPQIKEAYIDTGKVRLVYRDYPLGGAAMAAALIARCVDGQAEIELGEKLAEINEAWLGAQSLQAFRSAPTLLAKGSVAGAILGQFDVGGDIDLAAVEKQRRIGGLTPTAEEGLELGNQLVGVGFPTGEFEGGLSDGGRVLPDVKIEPAAGVPIEPEGNGAANRNT